MCVDSKTLRFLKIESLVQKLFNVDNLDMRNFYVVLWRWHISTINNFLTVEPN